MWPFKKRWSLKPLCGHWAPMIAQVAEDAGLYSEICVGPHIRSGRPHAQARAIVNGKMQWLGVQGREVTVAPCELAKVSGAHTPSEFMMCWRR